jgi:hypothetical protein
MKSALTDFRQRSSSALSSISKKDRGRAGGPRTSRRANGLTDRRRARPARTLTRNLRPFRKPDGTPIKPRVVKLADGRTARGYALEDFADAFSRY